MVDKRYQGMAVGVGSQRILGRVHMYEIEVAGAHLPTSFSILEKQPMDMLLGTSCGIMQSNPRSVPGLQPFSLPCHSS